MLPSEAVNAYGISQYVVQPSSLDLPLETVFSITKRERRTTYTHLDQQDKAWATKAQQDWPINVAINSQPLDMQDIKVWWTKDTTTISWSYFYYFSHFNKARIFGLHL
jgi:hypothetical protein